MKRTHVKLYEMLDIPGVDIVPDDQTETYNASLDTLHINPHIEINEETFRFILRLMGIQDQTPT